MNAPEFFAHVFGFDHMLIVGGDDSQYYYFTDTCDEGRPKTFTIRKEKVDMFFTALADKGPFITGILGPLGIDLPDHLMVCRALGSDNVAMYTRSDVNTEGGQAGNAVS